jgi:2-C-methyl-D-erythritol 2,4-cyclodiphosphate synthase
MFRVGFGQDSHRFSKDPARKLILGGIKIENEPGLEGNSDGDAVIHAICCALEQAIGGESFSVYADKMDQAGVDDSREYLKVAMSHIKESGYAINNIGISLECQKPRIIPIAERMKEALLEILEIEKSQIGINATSGEEMTAFGRGEGIQVFAIISLTRNEKN